MIGKPFRVVVSVLVFWSILTVFNTGFAQQQEGNTPAANPLLRLLQAKGILTEEEVAQINGKSTPGDMNQRLAELLLSKGVISQSEYDRAFGAARVSNVSAAPLSNASVIPAVYRMPANSPVSGASANSLPAAGTARSKAAPAPPEGPTVVPAIAPIRVFPVGGLAKGEMKPMISMGNLHVTPYGFIKATFVHDSSSPGGDDFPLPGFMNDTGPQGAPEFHIRARSSRFGANFEWLDPSPNLTITGKIEADFEGDFTRVDNRNLSTIRSSQPSIRLAYVRLDYKVGERDTFSSLFGQDWTPFASSTLPTVVETMLSGGGFGTTWERDPQMRFGWTHDFGKFKLMPEVAAVLPASGDQPGANNLANQLGYGERQGPDSARPTVEGRVVVQFQLDHAPGVAPAQLIISGEQGERKAIVTAAGVPTLPATDPRGATYFKTAFPNGAAVSSTTNGWTGEFQLPTRYFTLIGKYYSGSDLRWFFGGQFFSNFNDTAGLTGTSTVPSIDGASNVVFGSDASGAAVVAPQRPVRTAGGFVNLGIPLSRIFGADPQGRNMGWSLYLHYGTDFAKARDVERFNTVGARHKSSLYGGTLFYKLNNWVTFAFEQGLYETDALPSASGALPLFRGVPSRTWRDLRSEGGPIFTF
jgi:hypothetical protein